MSVLDQGLARYVTEEQRQKLAAVTVGIAGAGGLGSNCAMLLARSGIKSFVLADFDVIESSNLNRQFFFEDQVGQYKVSALENNLRAIDPDLTLSTHVLSLDAATSVECFRECTIVVEAFDGVASKKMLAELALSGELGVDFFVSASGMAGWGGKAMQKRSIRDSFIIVGDFSSDIASMPPMAPRVMIAAAMQADAVLEYILGTCTQEK